MRRMTQVIEALSLATFLLASGAWAAGADDEEEDPAPGAKAAPAPAPAAAKPVPAVVVPAATAKNEQELVSGAPVYNPNVAVHIVEERQFSDSGKREVAVYPVPMQVNGKFTQHYGSALGFTWHLQENFGIQLTGQYNWITQESGFNNQLANRVSQAAQAATSLLWVWGALGGVEVAPIYGKFAWFEESLGHFSVVINGGAGYGGTRIQIKPSNSFGPATYGDAGGKFLASVGAGFRLQLGKRFAFRLEVRDIVYTAQVETVNGCTRDDLKAMDAIPSTGDLNNANVSSGCRVTPFETVDPSTGKPVRTDVKLAYNLIKTPSSDVLNNVNLYLGASFIF